MNGPGPYRVRNPLDDRLHFGELKAMSESPQHYLLACSEVRKPWSEAVRIGLVTDCLVFGQREVRVYRGVASDEDGKTLDLAATEAAAAGGAVKKRNTPRIGKAWQAFEAESIAAGAVTCIQSEYDKACGAAEALLFPKTEGAKYAADLMARATERQVILQWESRGFECATGIHGQRGGLDGFGKPIGKSKGILIDLKVTADVEPEVLMRHIARMKWHCQLAWYLDALDAEYDTRGSEYERFNICVEADAPHVVTVIEHGDDAIEAGDKAIALWLGKLHACESSGNWGGYVDRPVVLELPEWAE